MIVLDTNVISEPLKAEPNVGVLGWLEMQRDVAVTAVTVGELLVGVRSLPEGRRRDGLADAVEAALAMYGRRVLEYGAPAAREYAGIREECRLRGQGLAVEDGMIAAIVRTHGGALATRNLSDFGGLGIDLVNPWDHQA